MKIAYYGNAVIHTLGKSDQDVVTFPKAHCLNPEKASHKEIWSLTPPLNKQNKKAQARKPDDKILAPFGQWPRVWIWMSHFPFIELGLLRLSAPSVSQLLHSSLLPPFPHLLPAFLPL